MITLERAGVLLYRHRAATDPRVPLSLLGRIKDLSTIPDLHGSLTMKTNEDGVLLRIFAGESDEVDGKPLHQAVVQKARELGLAGATVLRGSMGFGANSVLHTSKVLELSTDLPIVIELVDSEENIRILLPHLDAMVHEGMITMESVRILLYRHNPGDAPPPDPPHAPVA
jgi:PII-like signaling protein